MTQKSSKNYFTQDTEDAIVLYNRSSDDSFRNRIYNERIKYAFFKLTENIIHTYKFYHTDQGSIDDLQHEVTTFLLSKVHLFNPDKGAKAYSYFGTIAKRYLIMTNTKNYKRKIEKVGVSEVEDDLDFSYDMTDDSGVVDNLSYFLDLYVEFITENIFEIFPREEDAKIADAVLELFRKRAMLDIINKKALYIYIREQIDVKTPKITKVANLLYSIFKQSYAEFIETGEVTFPKI